MNAVTRPHGTRARYVFGPGPGQDRSAGCRCDACVNANRAYARFQQKRKRLEGLGRTSGPWAAPFVDAAPVRAHLLALADAGVGSRRVAELAGVSRTALLAIRGGTRSRCRRQVAEAVLAVEVEPAGGTLVDARETWKLIRRILRRPGWTKARISAEIGQGGRALQLGRRRITARNARAAAELAARVGVISPPVDRRRFPLDPVLARHTIAEAARAAGFHSAQLSRWKRTGVPAAAADRLAVALGRHPLELWPDWDDDQAEAAS